jgi:hypothetical protein
MKVQGATTILKKEAEFLGLTMKELKIMVQRNPYAFPNKVIEAFGIYYEKGI